MARFTYRYREYDQVRETHSFYKDHLLGMAFYHLSDDKCLPLAIKENGSVILEGEDILFLWQDELFKYYVYE